MEYKKPESEYKKPEEGVRLSTFEIVERIALIRESQNGKNRLELNRIKWDGRHPVYDLRLWVQEEDGHYKPTRGVKMYYEDVLMLSKVLVDL